MRPEAEVGGLSEVLLHDGTFEGFLSLVFSCVRLRIPVRDVHASSRHAPSLLDEPQTISTDLALAERVWEGLRKKGGDDIAAMVHGAFLSELPGIDTALWHFLRKLFANSDGSRGRNMLDEHVHAVYCAAQKTSHEAHLFQGFVRFCQAPDGSMFSVIAPDHNILPLLAPHFLARYPDVTWLIADSGRGLCLGSDGTTARIQACEPALLPSNAADVARLAAGEDARFRDLWLAYYDAINIVERRNTKQMTRFLPRKYWRYLPERA